MFIHITLCEIHNHCAQIEQIVCQLIGLNGVSNLLILKIALRYTKIYIHVIYILEGCRGLMVKALGWQSFDRQFEPYPAR